VSGKAFFSPILVCIVALSGCREEELDIVARGRYIELATDRDEAVCAGTVPFMDDYVEAVAALLGETLPNRVFIRYEWLDIAHGNTSKDDALRLVRSNLLPHEHELVHAVHGEVWPASRSFFHEGLAVLLDNRGYILSPWPEDASLDLLLEASGSSEVDYYQAWFLVSQIVREHDFDGLREFWLAVPPDASASEIRATYQALFDQPISALFEPEIMFPGEEYEYEVPRYGCHFAVCVGEPTPWQGDMWSGEAVVGCEDDPHAVGPTPLNFAAPVWRPHVAEIDEGSLRMTASAGVGAVFRPCQLQCRENDPAFGAVGTSKTQVNDPFYWPGLLRVEVGRELEDIPADEPGTLQFERLDP